MYLIASLAFSRNYWLMFALKLYITVACCFFSFKTFSVVAIRHTSLDSSIAPENKTKKTFLFVFSLVQLIFCYILLVVSF